MKPLAILAIVLALLVEAVGAWDEPGGFRDIPWGSPPSVVKEKLPDLSCGKSCFGSLTIGQVRVFAMIEFETGGGMDFIYLSFPSSNFYQIKVAFVERYGEPTSRRSQTVQNRMGAQFENEILEWTGEKVVIDLQKYSSKLPDSRASIQTIEGRRARLERFREKVKEGKKDL